jgi:hypothetical protein
MIARRRSLAVFVALIGASAAVTFARAPIPSTTVLTINPNPVVVGDPSPTMVATVTPDSGSVTEGKLRIQKMVDDVTLLPVACGTPASHGVVFDEEDPTDGTLTNTSADTSVIGSFGYFAQYVPSGGTGIHESQSGCFNLDVVPPACSGLQIAATAAAGTNTPVPGATWNGGFEITITNCGLDPLPGVTAQGGSSGWTTVTGINPDTGLAGVKATKGKTSTQVIQWNVGTMAAGAKAKIVVSESGFIKAGTPSGTVFFLNGPWSAQTGGVKTDYTGRITITVP